MTPDELFDIEARRILAWVFIRNENHGTDADREGAIRERAIRALEAEQKSKPRGRRPKVMRVATILGAGCLTLALGLAPAGATPTRTGCERVATQAANASGFKLHTKGWDAVYALAYSKCMAGQKIPDYRKPVPAPFVWQFTGLVLP